MKKDLIKVAALLIHAAKIDENYSKKEEKIIKKTLLKLVQIMKILKKYYSKRKKN